VEPAQLAAEIAEGAWVVVAGRTGDVFADPGLDLWRRVLRRQGGKLALLGHLPGGPKPELGVYQGLPGVTSPAGGPIFRQTS
jgi:hypothetical protein